MEVIKLNTLLSAIDEELQTSLMGSIENLNNLNF